MRIPLVGLQNAESCGTYNFSFCIPDKLARSKEFISLELLATTIGLNGLQANMVHFPSNNLLTKKAVRYKTSGEFTQRLLRLSASPPFRCFVC